MTSEQAFMVKKHTKKATLTSVLETWQIELMTVCTINVQLDVGRYTDSLNNIVVNPAQKHLIGLCQYLHSDIYTLISQIELYAC